jgi:hypothetical protein
MKKTLVGLILALGGISAHANVLCNIITKDPRYNVSSYVRSQTACVNTTYANASGIGTQVARLGTLVLVASAISYLTEQNYNSKVEAILSGNYKILNCIRNRDESYEFLVGKEYAINRGTSNTYTRTADGVYERGMFTSYKLDTNTMTVSGNGLMGNAGMNCQVKEEINNGEPVEIQFNEDSV